VTIIGIDEVGRGSWAGPLVVGAVILSRPIDGLKDSKLLSAKQRQRLNGLIYAEAQAIGLGWVSAAEIDRLGLTRSIRLAIKRALKQIKIKYNQIIIDGNINYLSDNPLAKAIIKADVNIAAVSAASIVAKVARDSYMSKAAEIYKGYGFETHVGYGTASHLIALNQLGVCLLHRRSYKPIRLLIENATRSKESNKITSGNF
jgi:ribonuclease HII